MKKITLSFWVMCLTLLVASCHGKQIVPAGEPEPVPDSDYVQRIDLLVQDGNSMVKFMKDSVFITGDTILLMKMMKDQLMKQSKSATIIHNTDTITAYPGDTVRIKN